MKADIAKSSKPFRHDKLPVYQALSPINESFEVIEKEVGRLQNYNVRPGEPLYLFRAEELKAGINHRLVDLLKMREERDWANWQKHRLIREQKLNPELRRKSGIELKKGKHETTTTAERCRERPNSKDSTTR